MTDTDDLPAATRVGRISLSVTDLGETCRFYRDVVGLAVLARDGGVARLGAGGTPLLVLREDPAAGPRPRAATGLYHVAFRVPDRAALGDAVGRVRERWQLDGASDHQVSEALYLTDPEDNGVEIYCDRPRSEWPTDAAGRIRMESVPLDLEALAAASAGNDSVPAGADVGHVHIEVSSLPAARAFYADTLGLRVREARDRALFLAAGDYHHHVGLNTWNGRTDAPEGRGLDRFELVVPDPGTLEAARERLAAGGVDVTARDGGGLAVTDPDGIRLCLRVEG